MRTRGKELRKFWWYMLEVPWRHSGEATEDERFVHWSFWLEGWAWTLAGVLLGALLAPSLLRRAGLSTAQYQDWIAIGVAVLAGVLTQALSLHFNQQQVVDKQCV